MIHASRILGITALLLLNSGCAWGHIGRSWGVKLQIFTLEITEQETLGLQLTRPARTNGPANFPEPSVNLAPP